MAFTSSIRWRASRACSAAARVGGVSDTFGSIVCGMRVKTSVTLPEELLRSLDRAAGSQSNRSRLIEQAVRQLLEARARAERDAKDIETINRHAERLNAEAADVLGYQVKI